MFFSFCCIFFWWVQWCTLPKLFPFWPSWRFLIASRLSSSIIQIFRWLLIYPRRYAIFWPRTRNLLSLNWWRDTIGLFWEGSIWYEGIGSYFLADELLIFWERGYLWKWGMFLFNDDGLLNDLVWAGIVQLLYFLFLFADNWLDFLIGILDIFAGHFFEEAGEESSGVGVVEVSLLHYFYYRKVR